jgi:hypothetical protein
VHAISHARRKNTRANSYRFEARRRALEKLRFAAPLARRAAVDVRAATRFARFRAMLAPRFAAFRARPPAATALRSKPRAFRFATLKLLFTAFRIREPAAAAFRFARRGPAPVASRRAFFTVAATVPSVDPIVRATSTNGPSALLDELLMSSPLSYELSRDL